MIRTIIESPLGSRPDGTRIAPDSSEFKANQRYVDDCMLDSFRRGEAPFASHGIYPRILNDATPEERKQGMHAGFAWGEVADRVAVYVDRGVTPGMLEGIARHAANGIQIVFRLTGLRKDFLDVSLTQELQIN